MHWLESPTYLPPTYLIIYLKKHDISGINSEIFCTQFPDFDSLSLWFSGMPGDFMVTDAAAEAIYQLITASAGLPGAWDDGKWCSAAVCRSSDIESSR